MRVILTYEQPLDIATLADFSRQLTSALEQRNNTGYADYHEPRIAYWGHRIHILAQTPDELRGGAALYLESIARNPQFVSYRGSRIVRPEFEQRGLELALNPNPFEGLRVAQKTRKNEGYFLKQLRLST